MKHHFGKRKGLLILVLFCCLMDCARSQDVVINEIMAAPSERLLIWDNDDEVHLGPGMAWYTLGFNHQDWASAPAPMGFEHKDLATDLERQMKDQTPSLYLRKVFTLSDDQIGLGQFFSLSIDYEDGFVAYLNGHEIARRNLGAKPAFVFCDQPAYNGRFGSGDERISLVEFSPLLDQETMSWRFKFTIM